MDTLHERLAELADEAPTGGAPAAELWARGKRAQRLRVAAVAATVLVVGAVGTGVGVGLADGGREGSEPAPAGTVEVSLPIEYPATRELPDLGDAPGPLAAIWVTPREGGGAPEVVGLVAETGVFGTLPIDVQVEVEYKASEPGIALSPDGRRIAYNPRKGEPRAAVVQDLVSGEKEIPRDRGPRPLGVRLDRCHPPLRQRLGARRNNRRRRLGMGAGDGGEAGQSRGVPRSAIPWVRLALRRNRPDDRLARSTVVCGAGAGHGCDDGRRPAAIELRSGRVVRRRGRRRYRDLCLVIGIPSTLLVSRATRGTPRGRWSRWTSTAPTVRT